MSYDISLNDPVTGKVANVPGHLMHGGTYRADYHPETGTFTPALNTDADLNITYNYGRYYYEVYPEQGIRTIYGMSGYDSIAVLEKMIAYIDEKYKRSGEWITTKREKTVYYDSNGEEVDFDSIILGKKEYVRDEKIEIDVWEGDTSDYWLATAANAMKPLYQLIVLAKMRPDCIWDGD